LTLILAITANLLPKQPQLLTLHQEVNLFPSTSLLISELLQKSAQSFTIGM